MDPVSAAQLPGLADFLASAKLFQSLDAEERQDLAGAFERVTAATGTKLFKYGDVGQELFLVESGSVELSIRDTTGEKIVLTHMGPGEVFGELSVLDGGPRSASAETVEPSQVLVLSRDRLSRFLTAHPSASLDLLAVLASRIRDTDRLLMTRVARNLNTEVAHEFSFFQRIANWIAMFSGSMPFLMLNAAFFAIWISWNVGIIPGAEPFDPYPFGFLTMAVSLEAIFLSIFVLLAQNVQAAKDKIRSDIEYEVNLKAELEIAELHSKIDHLHTEIVRALRNR